MSISFTEEDERAINLNDVLDSCQACTDYKKKPIWRRLYPMSVWLILFVMFGTVYIPALFNVSGAAIALGALLLLGISVARYCGLPGYYCKECDDPIGENALPVEY